MYELVHEKLTISGYDHYEVSNWCKIGFECKHNLTYWKDESYFGCGLGASGYEGDTRYTNTKTIIMIHKHTLYSFSIKHFKQVF